MILAPPQITPATFRIVIYIQTRTVIITDNIIMKNY